MVSKEKILTFKRSVFYVLETIKTSMGVAKKEILLYSTIETLLIPIPLIQAYLAKLIMDQISLRLQGQGGDTNLVLFYLFLEFLTMITPPILGVFKNYHEGVMSRKITLYFKERFFNKLEQLDLTQLEDPRLQNEIQEIRHNSQIDARQLLADFFDVARGLFLILSFFGLLLSHNVFIAFALVLVAGLSFKVNYGRSKATIAHYKSSRFGTRFRWYLENLLIRGETSKEIKALDVGSHIRRQHLQILSKELEDQHQVQYQGDRKRMAMESISKGLYYLSYGWIVLETLDNRLTLGDMTMVLMLFTQTQGGLASIFRSVVSLYEKHEKLKTLFDFWQLPTTRTSEATSEEMESVRRNFDIEFENVSFSYPDSSKKVLENFDLKIASGKKVALVGENGAGKSTLIKLLLGLYEPTSGRILLGGIDLKKFSRTQLKELMGVVFQDYIRLLGESIKGNVVLGDLKAGDESYDLAKTHAGVDEVLRDLGKEDSEVVGKEFSDDGVELSGGQWQKLALGRAFIQSGKIIILDEPTSSIDAKAEHEIFTKFQELTNGKTSVLVSHRFSTVRMADEILYLDEGKIIERGTHRELLSLEGQYARMFHLQAQGYK